MGNLKFNTREEYIEYTCENLLSTQYVTEILGVSRQYLNILVKDNKIKPVVNVGRFNLFYKPDVLKYKATRKKVLE